MSLQHRSERKKNGSGESYVGWGADVGQCLTFGEGSCYLPQSGLPGIQLLTKTTKGWDLAIPSPVVHTVHMVERCLPFGEGSWYSP